MPGIAITALTDDSDAVAAGSVGAVSLSRLTGYNGATYDRIRTLGATSLLGLGQLAVSLAVPGASRQKSIFIDSDPGETRATIVTPASGKKIRVISVHWAERNAGAASHAWLYFGTGSTPGTTADTVVSGFGVRGSSRDNYFNSWGDGQGNVGDVDEVLSYIHDDASLDNIRVIVMWREE